MYEKILAQLVSKNPGVSKTVLGLIAEKLAERVTDENQIEGVISDFETNSPVSIKDYAELLQKEGDRRVSDALKKKSTDPAPTNPPAPGNPSDPTDVSKIVAEQLAKALEPIKAMTQTIQHSSKINSLKAQLKAKGIDESWADLVTISDDYDEATAVAGLEERWNKAIQTGINQQVKEGKIRVSSGNDGSGFQDVVKSWSEEKAPSKESGFNIKEV